MAIIKKRYERKDLPVGLKVVTDIKKMLNIQEPEKLSFLVLTDASMLDRDVLISEKARVYLIISSKSGANAVAMSNEKFILSRELEEFNLVAELEADAGQIENIKNEFSNKKQESVSSEETSSKENKELEGMFDNYIREGLEDNASDIHIEKRRDSAVIKMRKNGELVVTTEDTDKNVIVKLCTMIYNTLSESEGKEPNFLTNKYQQSAINRKIRNEEVKLRFQSLPTYPDGFDVVLRLLPIGQDDEKILPLTSLGFEPSQERQIKEIISKPVGALVIAGTTGSGKSTTLKNLLMSVNLARDYKCKIYTIEDPPEYKIPRVSQLPVKRLEGAGNKNPFEAPLLAAMRGDPDLIMIGEIRDALTGDGLKKATQSGHQVMTTVHASSGLGIIERLLDFGLTPNIMAGPDLITGLIYQKLLPVLCSHCSESFTTLSSSAASNEDVIDLEKRLDDVFSDISASKKKNVDIKIRSKNGCDKCRHTGISGRTICAEVISPDFTMRDFFKVQDSAGALKYWLSMSDQDVLSSNMIGKSAQEHAIYKMSKGLISPFDLEVAFGPVNHTKIKRSQLASQVNKEQDQLLNLLKKQLEIPEEVLSRVQSKISSPKNEEENQTENSVDITSGLADKLRNF